MTSKNEALNAKLDALDDALDDALAVAIFDLLRHDNQLSQSGICQKTGRSRSSVQRAMQKLQDVNLIWRIGGKRSGSWQLAQE